MRDEISSGPQGQWDRSRWPDGKVPEEWRLYYGTQGKYIVRDRLVSLEDRYYPQAASSAETEPFEETEPGAEAGSGAETGPGAETGQRRARYKPSRPPPRRRSPPNNRGKSSKPAASPAAPSPLERLKQAAAGEIDLAPEDLQRILLDQLVDEHSRLKELDSHVGGMLEMLFSAQEDQTPARLTAMIDLISKLEANRERRSRGMVRLTELLHKVSDGPRPRLQVVAAAAQVNVGQQNK